jgi:hypothetical protein
MASFKAAAAAATEYSYEQTDEEKIAMITRGPLGHLWLETGASPKWFTQDPEGVRGYYPINDNDDVRKDIASLIG